MDNSFENNINDFFNLSKKSIKLDYKTKESDILISPSSFLEILLKKDTHLWGKLKNISNLSLFLNNEFTFKNLEFNANLSKKLDSFDNYKNLPRLQNFYNIKSNDDNNYFSLLNLVEYDDFVTSNEKVKINLNFKKLVTLNKYENILFGDVAIRLPWIIGKII